MRSTMDRIRLPRFAFSLNNISLNEDGDEVESTKGNPALRLPDSGQRI